MSQPIPIPKSKSEPDALDTTLSPNINPEGSSSKTSLNQNTDASPSFDDSMSVSSSYFGTSPPTPGLSRSSSSASFHFMDDIDEFPPLDRMTVFDVLDNFALRERLEKIQSSISRQTEKVRKSQQRLRTRGRDAKDRVVGEFKRRVPTSDERLSRYRKRMTEGVDQLGDIWNDSKTVTVRDKISFIAGVMNIFVSGYLIGAYPQYFHLWYSAQLFYFMPIRYFTYHSKGYHYFLADLCYFVNFLLVLSIWMFPRSKRLLVATYCLAYGNNAVAIVMWRNSLVFHSLDKVTSLFIHIMPCVTLHCLVHLVPQALQAERFPAIYKIKTSAPHTPYHYSLPGMMIWATVPYAIWQLSYHTLITVRRREKIAAGRPTSFTWLRKSYGKTFLGRLVLSLPDALQEPAFMLIQYCYALITMAPCPLWFWYKWLSAGFLTVVFIWSVYNGANYYIEVFGKRFQKELETLKKDVAKWQQSPEMFARSPVMTPSGELNGKKLDELNLGDPARMVAGEVSARDSQNHSRKASLDQIPSLDSRVAEKADAMADRAKAAEDVSHETSAKSTGVNGQANGLTAGEMRGRVTQNQ